ncbi:hypothetical protein FRB93_002896, partial [Tulasnella sp. JGI-2019a]
MNRNVDYSNFVSIIQSSGCGKSRMVHEQATLVFTIPFNLRDPSESTGVSGRMAYPPSDETIYNHFLNFDTSNNNFFPSFFAQLFLAFEEEVTSAAKEWTKNQNPFSGREQLATLWRNHLTDERRQSLYSRVVLRHKQVLRTGSNLSGNHAFTALKSLCDTLRGMTTETRATETKTNEGSGPPVEVMVYFDEAHTLMPEKSPTGDNRTRLDLLCSSLTHFIKLPIFFIFLSTASSLSGLAPAAQYYRSSRARDASNDLQAPISETPFDCSPMLPISFGISMAELSTEEFMSRFGRPLFWSMLSKEASIDIIGLARSKLILRHGINVPFNLLTPAVKTAVLDLRLRFEYEPTRKAARARDSELVQSHMRFVQSVPKSREYMRSSYPSEPILAEAAAQQMN